MLRRTAYLLRFARAGGAQTITTPADKTQATTTTPAEYADNSAGNCLVLSR